MLIVLYGGAELIFLHSHAILFMCVDVGTAVQHNSIQRKTCPGKKLSTYTFKFKLSTVQAMEFKLKTNCYANNCLSYEFGSLPAGSLELSFSAQTPVLCSIVMVAMFKYLFHRQCIYLSVKLLS